MSVQLISREGFYNLGLVSISICVCSFEEAKYKRATQTFTNHLFIMSSVYRNESELKSAGGFPKDKSYLN